MKLATQRTAARDGQLLVVSQDALAACPAPWPTLQAALDDWDVAQPQLERTYQELNAGALKGQTLRPEALAAPLPRTHDWLDGSAYLNHVVLARQARGAAPPAQLSTNPLVYQGGGGHFLGPRDNFVLQDPGWGLDFEAELCVILGDVPQGTRAAEAADHVRLITLVNDWTLRNLVPAELAKGFGFVQSKPATAFGPLAVTPDELGKHWHDGRVHVQMRCQLNGAIVGALDAGPEMHFSFYDLLEHVARTRRLGAGAVLGSGTISNSDRSHGVACLAEKRAIETVEHGAPVTPFLQPGDLVQIEAFANGNSVFGALQHKVTIP